MKNLILFTWGLMLSLSVNSQTLKNEEWKFIPKSISSSESSASPKTGLENIWHAFSPTFAVRQFVQSPFSFSPENPFPLDWKLMDQQPNAHLEKGYAFDKYDDYLEKKALFQQKLKLIGGLTFRGSLEVLACDDELFHTPETANFSIRIH